jgi:hypothetical protein
MVIKLFSVKTKNLDPIILSQIIKLKNSFWRYGVKSHYFWFKNNIDKDDIHNLLILDNNLVGYTALRKRFFFIKKKISYLYFDTLIITKKLRGTGLLTVLMGFNNFIIKKKNVSSFLLCNKNSINLYKEFNWKVINKNRFCTFDHKHSKYGMIFNFNKNTLNRKIVYYLNKV